jgi:hypothetical protein
MMEEYGLRILHSGTGLGRAPATALAYMYWFRGFSLEDAFAKLRAVRPCNPRLQAIREATCDVLIDQGHPIRAKLVISRSGYGQAPQVRQLVLKTRAPPTRSISLAELQIQSEYRDASNILNGMCISSS